MKLVGERLVQLLRNFLVNTNVGLSCGKEEFVKPGVTVIPRDVVKGDV